MRCRPLPILIILLIPVIFNFGCKKDKSQINTVPKDNYSGNYSFKTTTILNTGIDTIRYDGSVSYDTASKILTITYMPENTLLCPSKVYPVVDSKGVLSDPDFVNQISNGFFTGNIDEMGNLSFKIGFFIYHHGDTYENSNTVTGKKKQ